MKRAMMVVGACGLVIGGLALGGLRADRPSEAAANQAFERLKALEGFWLMCDDEGKVTEEVGSVYHVTAGGAAVMETMFPGQPHEMLTVYFVEEGTLHMTHYCMLGNRPELDATRIDGTTIDWACGEGSVCCGSEQHMHAATFDLSGQNRITTTWRGDAEGEDKHEVTFILQRAPGAAR